MKKIISSALLLLCACMAVNAASFQFYINPGHGGHDSDDRPTPQPLGVAIYYESDGNLVRGLYVKEFLDAMGVKNAISRTTNTSSDDLNLTYIATLSSNYGGYFWSLHSNGANASANYHIALYKGSNSTNSISPSKAMAYANSKWAYAQNLTNCSYCTARSMADYDLMGWHYGVLRTNTQPGFLVEAWFHDYRPESLRMKSDHYEKFLAWQQVRSAMESPGGFGTKVLKGCVVGDVRDLSQSCGYTSYTTRGRDSYLALNGAKAELYSGSSAVGTPVQTCTTDNCCNGVWGFFDITAGTYTVKISKDGYKSQTKTFTVSNGTQQAWQVSLVQGVDAGISVSSGAVAFGEITAGESSTKTVTITGQSLTSNITVTNSNTSQFTVTPTSLGTSGGTLTVKYNPATAGSHSATITLTSGSYSAKITATGKAKNPPLKFTEGWNYSEKSNKKAAWMENWTNYRNMAFADGKLYIVDATNGKVLIVKAQTAEKIGELDMTGVSGGALKLVDVACVDGKVLGTNIATNATGNETLKVYIWDNDTSAPRVLLETTDLGGMTRIGDAIEVQGNLTSGKIVYLGQETRDYTDDNGNAANGNCNSLVTYAITNGVVSTTPVVADIEGFIIGMSPRAIPDGNAFWVAGQSYLPSKITAAGELTTSIPLTAFNIEAAFHGCGNDIVPFTFNGTQYAFATDYQAVTKAGTSATAEEIKTTTLLGGRAVLIDGSEGWAVEGLTNSGNYPSAGLGSTTRNGSLSTSLCVNVNGSAGVEMWVLVHNQGIAYYKHGTAPVYNYGPTVTASTSVLELTTTQNHSETGTITVAGNNLEGDISIALSGTNADQFSIDETTIAKADGAGTITVTYDPTELGSHTATLTISSANATSITVTLKGTCNPNTYLDDENIELTEVWTSAGKSWFSTASPATRFIAYNNGKLYGLNATPWNTSPVINIIDAYTGAAAGTVSVDGISGGLTCISSIRFVGDVLVGANAAASNHTFTVYAWKDGLSSAPTKILEDATHGSVTMGSNISISGNLTNGRIWATDDSCKNVLYYTITNGTVSTTPKVLRLTDASGNVLKLEGSRGASEVIPNSDGTFWVDAQSSYPRLFDANGKQTAIMQAGALNSNTRGTALKFFSYGTRKLAAGVAYSAASQANGYFVLVDVADGAANATGFLGDKKYPEAGLGSSANAQNMSSLCVATDRENGDVLDVWVCCCLQGVAHYTYNGRKLVGIEDVVVEPEDVEVALVKNGGTLEVVGVEAAAVAVYSINGALVRMVNNANEVDVEGLNGVYVVAVVDAAGATHTQKVILK